MLNQDTDTIAAVATPPGSGGVAIVRLSGPRSLALGLSLFRSHRPDFAGFKPSRMHFGEILDEHGQALDQGLMVAMPGPGSFTGEDVLEIHCHGGRGMVRAVLGAVLASGARLAGPGEFTLRAYLNGRLDLTQAEAVAELVSAPTRAALGWAKVKLDGALGRRVRDLRASLEDLRVKLTLAVDFPEDEVECCPPDELISGVEQTLRGLRSLLAGVRRAGLWREGALVVLAGRVNAGKSSLLNALLGRERAIVADLPGTTRDYLEETLDLEGLPVRLMDTAGLRDTGDVVEMEGLRLGQEFTEQADLVVLVVDRSQGLEARERALLERLGPARVLVALNKADLPARETDLAEELAGQGFEVLVLSAKQGLGLEDLATAMRRRLLAAGGEPDPDAPVPNARQATALARAAGELEALAVEAAQGLPYDLLGVRLELACSILSEVTGEMAPQQVLDQIFSRFCIGK